MTKSPIALISAGVATAVLCACGGYGIALSVQGNETDNGPKATIAATPTTQPPNSEVGAGQAAPAREDKPKVLKVQQVKGLTPIVTSASGRTVYRFDNDSANPSTSTCVDACTQTWEPVLAGTGEPGTGVVVEGGGIDERDLGTLKRAEGLQVTLNGWPLYYYKDDLELGQLKGQGTRGLWFAANPQGGKAKSTAPVVTPTLPADKDVQVLTVSEVEGFMPFVTNEKGRTIYRFDKDSPKPPRTNCSGDCAKIWEPVLAGKKGFKIQGGKIKSSAVGTIDRPEGKQLTLNGWPLYYFHLDKKLGQTAGYGVNNLWFAIAPNGKKAVRCL